MFRHSDHDSIFGDTYHGVPSPQVLHDHPYPTRYHGPNYAYPYFGKPYRENPNAVPSFLGFGAPLAGPMNGLGACGACSAPKAGGADGLSGMDSLTASPTGSLVIDALVGGIIGGLMAKSSSDRLVWAGGGAVAAMLAGAIGLVGVVAAGAYVRRS